MPSLPIAWMRRVWADDGVGSRGYASDRRRIATAVCSRRYLSPAVAFACRAGKRGKRAEPAKDTYCVKLLLWNAVDVRHNIENGNVDTSGKTLKTSAEIDLHAREIQG
jgi:hypothetical protein